MPSAKFPAGLEGTAIGLSVLEMKLNRPACHGMVVHMCSITGRKLEGDPVA